MTRRTTTTDAGRVAHWPDLTYRYGLSFDELTRMPNGIRRIYEEALPRLLAEDQVASIDAASFPNMKKDAQRKLIDRLNKALRDGRPEEAEVITDGEAFTKRMAASGIGITAVDADGNVIEQVVGNMPVRPQPIHDPERPSEG